MLTKLSESVIKNHQNSKQGATENLKTLITSVLEEYKAEDVVVIDLAGKSDIADFMVIASGRSDRHVGAIASHLTQAIKKSGLAASTEGTNECNWVLIDAMDAIVHIFKAEARAFYNLEKMWAVALPEQSSVMLQPESADL